MRNASVHCWLTQVITGVVPGAYTISVRAKKTGANYTSYFYAQYNGNKYAYLFNTTSTFNWTEFSAVIPDVVDGTITIYAYNRLASLYVSDIILAEGAAVAKGPEIITVSGLFLLPLAERAAK